MRSRRKPGKHASSKKVDKKDVATKEKAAVAASADEEKVVAELLQRLR
jgi:translation elongation factor P/translation initiation factor 5A